MHLKAINYLVEKANKSKTRCISFAAKMCFCVLCSETNLPGRKVLSFVQQEEKEQEMKKERKIDISSSSSTIFPSLAKLFLSL